MTTLPEMLEQAPDHVKKYIDDLSDDSKNENFKTNKKLAAFFSNMIIPLIIAGLVWTMFYEGPQKISNLVVGFAWAYQILSWIMFPITVIIIGYAVFSKKDEDGEKIKALDRCIVNKKMFKKPTILYFIQQVITCVLFCLFFMRSNYILGSSIMLQFFLFTFFYRALVPEWTKKRFMEIVDTLNPDGTWNLKKGDI